MFKNGEIQSVLSQFEKDTTGRFDKESTPMWKKGIYYQDGEINNLFKMYLLGYSNGKCTGRLGTY